MSEYNTMSQNEMYDPNQPMYKSNDMLYDLPDSMIKAYTLTEGGSGILNNVPTMRILP